MGLMFAGQTNGPEQGGSALAPVLLPFCVQAGSLTQQCWFI